MAKRGRPRKVRPDDEFERNTAEAIALASARRQDSYELGMMDPTAEQAYEMAKLLLAGVPQDDALAYVLGSVEAGVLAVALPRWMQSRLVVDALATLAGGRWPDLEPDARLDVALDKHNAELAHYLYTHDFETAEGKELGKLKYAREALSAERSGRLQANSPFMKFLATILKPGALPAVPDSTEGQGRGEATRPATLGLVEVEPVVEGQVTETVEEPS